MQLRIHFDQEISPSLYRRYSQYLFKKVKDDIEDSIDLRKYKVREPYILSSKFIKWKGETPKSIRLDYFVCHCLELVTVKGEYVIRLNDSLIIPKSRTRVSLLVRLLEYGNERIPACPVIRKVLVYYSKVYKELLPEFLKEEVFR